MIFMANQIQLKVMSAEAWQGGNAQSLRYVRGIIRYLDAITGADLAELIEVTQMTQREEAIEYEDCTVAVTHLARHDIDMPIKMQVSKRAMQFESKEDLYQIIAHEYAHAWHHEIDFDSWKEEHAHDDEGHGEKFKELCKQLDCWVFGPEDDDEAVEELMNRLYEDSEWLDDYLIY